MSVVGYLDGYINENNQEYGLTDLVAQNGVKANTQLIADTVGFSAKNELDVDSNTSTQFEKNASGQWVNHTTDTLSTLDFRIQGRKNGSFVKYYAGPVQITTTGKKEFVLDILENDDVNELYIGHSGNTNNIMFHIPFTKKGKKIFSCNFIGVSPNTQNGLILDEIMIRDANILDNTYEPYRNTTAFPRDEQAVLGAENFFDYENVSKGASNVTYALITNGINVKSSSVEWASLSCFVPNKYKNKNTDFVCDLDWVSGHTQVNIYSNSTAATAGATLLASGSSLTADGKIKVSFNSGSADYLIVRLFVSGGTAEVGEANFTNMMLKFSDFNDDFVPFAMTNKQLTEQITLIDDTSKITFAEGVSVYGDTYFNFDNIGHLNVISGLIKGVTANAGTWVTIGNIASGFRPKKTFFGFAGTTGASDIIEMQIYYTGDIVLRKNGGAISSTDNIRIFAVYAS